MKKIILFVLGLVLVSSMVLAFGVSSPYWEEYPLEIAPGEEIVLDLNLQNMVGEDPVTVEAEITEGADIASLEQTRYTIQPATSETMALLTVNAPEEEGTYSVKVVFNTVAADEGGGVAIGIGANVEFDVIVAEPVVEGVGEEQPMSTSTIVGIIIAIIAIIVIVYIILKKKK